MVAEADDGGGDAATDDAAIVHRELEVLLAEMETRLRRAVLKVVRPTLDQSADLASRINGIEGKVMKHESMLNLSDTLKQDVKKLRDYMAVIQEQLATGEKQARKFEERTTGELSELRNRATACEQRLDNTEGDIRKSTRDSARVWDETQRLQVQHEESSKNMWSGIATTTKKTEQTRDELLERVAEMQKQHYDMVDELYGDGKGLTQIRVDIHALEVAVEPVPRLEERIEETLKKTLALEDQVVVSNGTCDDVSGQFEELKDSVDSRLTSFDESNNAVMNKLTAYHASILKNVRTEFVEEIQASKALREDISKFEDSTATFCRELQDMIQKEVARVDAVYKELVTDIDDIGKRFKKERVHLNSGLQRVEREAQVAQEIAEINSSSLEHFGKVMALMLEAERMGSALDIQEFADRCSECWLGPPSDAKRKPPLAYTAQSLDKLKPSYEQMGRGFAGEEMASLVPIDTKMGLAKLEYLPGAITFGGSQFDRKGFLQIQHQMLRKAKGFLDRGPDLSRPAPRPQPLSGGPGATAGHPGDLAAPSPEVQIAAQPAANGGQGGSEMPSGPPKTPKTGEDGGASEDPRTPAQRRTLSFADGGGHSVGQRPGSRHQPAGSGSRGSAPHGGGSPTSGRSGGSPTATRVLVQGDGSTSTKLPRIAGDRNEGHAGSVLSLGSSLPMEPLQLGGSLPQAKAKGVDFARRPGALTAR